MYWIKLYHEILSDPKMARLSDHQFRRCIELFLLAGEAQNYGHLPNMRDMCWKLRVTEQDLLQDLKELSEVGIVTGNGAGWVVVNWAKRQAPVTDKQRAAENRERKRKEKPAGAPPGRKPKKKED